MGISDAQAAISDPTIKDRLRKNTEGAIAQGVFGVPTFVVDGEIFWGGDATDMLLHYLQDRDLFETPEMKRVSDMPMGVSRRK